MEAQQAGAGYAELEGEATDRFPQPFGKFTLIRRIARGGMAEIMLAKAQGPWGFEKPLVVKRILSHLSDDSAFIEMFLSEAKIAARLHHPNVAQIYDLGRIDGQYFIAMEHVDGYTLLQILRQSRYRSVPIPINAMVHIIKEVAMGLAYAHDAKDSKGKLLNLVHRDVSPSNVMVSRDGVVKLVDFGVATASIQLHKTEAGAVKGKYGYMAPEQCQGQPVDRRSDIFSLGVVLFECTTGTRLFGAANPLETLRRILSGKIPDPCSIVSDYPEALREVVYKMLAMKPKERYQNASEVHHALETYIAGSAVGMSSVELSQIITDLFDQADDATASGDQGIRSQSTLSEMSDAKISGWDADETEDDPESTPARADAHISERRDPSIEVDDFDLPDHISVLSQPQMFTPRPSAVARRKKTDPMIIALFVMLAVMLLGSIAAWIVLLS